MIRMFAIALLLTATGVAGTDPAQPERQGTPKAAPPAPPAPNVWVTTQGRGSYLGVDIENVTADRVGPLKLKEERGVEVTMVDQDAPAGKAGVKEHDVIVDFNGTAVESEEQLRRLIREIPPGRTVTLGISRDGNPMKISVQLGDRGKIVAETRGRMVVPIPNIQIQPFPKDFSIQIDNPGFPVLGAQTENAGRQLCEFFGVKDGDCVLIKAVEKGGAAEKAGLKAGDVLIRADNEKLTGRSDLRSALRKHREGGKMTLVIVREKKEQNVTVDLPKVGGPGDSSWRVIDPDDIDSWREQIDEWKERIEPEMEKAREMAALRLRDIRSESAQLRLKMKELKPQIEKSMRENEKEFRRMQERLQRELKRDLSPMI